MGQTAGTPKASLLPQKILCVAALAVFLQLILGTAACDRKDLLSRRTRIVRLDATLNAIIPPQATIEKLAEGFQFTADCSASSGSELHIFLALCA